MSVCTCHGIIYLDCPNYRRAMGRELIQPPAPVQVAPDWIESSWDSWLKLYGQALSPSMAAIEYAKYVYGFTAPSAPEQVELCPSIHEVHKRLGCSREAGHSHLCRFDRELAPAPVQVEERHHKWEYLKNCINRLIQRRRNYAKARLKLLAEEIKVEEPPKGEGPAKCS